MMMTTANVIGRATSCAACRTDSSGDSSPCFCSQAVDGVLHHHDRAVDDHSEVDRAQAHQVRADAEQPHAEKADQHRERNDRGGDDRRPQVAEKQQQHDRHENEAFEQVLLDGVNRAVDHEGLIVERNDLHARRQPQAAIFSFTRSISCLPFSPFSMMTMPDTVSPLRSVAPAGGAEPMRTSATSRSSTGVPFLDARTMLPKSLGGDRAPGAEQRVLLRGMLDVAAAEVGVVVLDALRHVVQRQPVLLEQRRIDHDLKLLGLPAPRVDLADAGNRAQLRL